MTRSQTGPTPNWPHYDTAFAGRRESQGKRSRAGRAIVERWLLGAAHRILQSGRCSIRRWRTADASQRGTRPPARRRAGNCWSEIAPPQGLADRTYEYCEWHVPCRIDYHVDRPPLLSVLCFAASRRAADRADRRDFPQGRADRAHMRITHRKHTTIPTYASAIGVTRLDDERIRRMPPDRRRRRRCASKSGGRRIRAGFRACLGIVRLAGPYGRTRRALPRPIESVRELTARSNPSSTTSSIGVRPKRHGRSASTRQYPCPPTTIRRNILLKHPTSSASCLGLYGMPSLSNPAPMRKRLA